MRFVIPKLANAKAANPANKDGGEESPPPQHEIEKQPPANAKAANPANDSNSLAALAGLALAVEEKSKMQVLLTLAAKAGFPEYRIKDHWVFIPEGKEAWQRNLQAMLKTHPKDLPRVLAWLEADLKLMG